MRDLVRDRARPECDPSPNPNPNPIPDPDPTPTPTPNPNPNSLSPLTLILTLALTLAAPNSLTLILSPIRQGYLKSRSRGGIVGKKGHNEVKLESGLPQMSPGPPTQPLLSMSSGARESPVGAQMQLQAEDVARLLLWRHRDDSPDALDLWLDDLPKIELELEHVLENGPAEMKKHMEANQIPDRNPNFPRVS